MNKHQLYDPEDLESLLEHKSFNDLYPEERQFVLRHIDSESEYESLRETLLTLRGLVKNEVDIEPNRYVRKNVMDVFAAQHKRPGFSLNAWFVLISERLNGYRPALAFGAVLGIVGIAMYVYFSGSTDAEMLADNHQTPRVNRTINTDGGNPAEFEELIPPSVQEEMVEQTSTVTAENVFEPIAEVAADDLDVDNSVEAEEISIPSGKEATRMIDMVAEAEVKTTKDAESVPSVSATEERNIAMAESMDDNITSVPTSTLSTLSIESVQISAGSTSTLFTAAPPVVEKVYFNWVKTAY